MSLSITHAWGCLGRRSQPGCSRGIRLAPARRQSGRVLSEMWFRVVRKQIPLPHALLTAIHVLEKRLAVPRLPCFPDGHALPWSTQCTTALRAFVPSSMFSTTHALPLRISGEATSGSVETDVIAPCGSCIGMSADHAHAAGRRNGLQCC